MNLLDLVRKEVAEVVEDSRQCSIRDAAPRPAHVTAMPCYDALTSGKPIIRVGALDTPDTDGKLAELETHVGRIVAMSACRAPSSLPIAKLLTDLISTVLAQGHVDAHQR